jgi:hypothetical protein
LGSDHIDGPVTKANAVADLIDLYAFPTPGKPSQLTLILDAYPFVSSSGHFSDKVNYNFILRKTSAAPDGSHFITDPSSEVVITCKFITPERVSGTQIICASQEAQPRIIGQIAFNETRQPTVGNNIQLFAGRRAEPFFLSKNFAASYMQFKQIAPDANNVMVNLNCLSIVMNIEINQLFPPATDVAKKHARKDTRKVAQSETYLIAVAAESIAFDSPHSSPRRMDRLGRPEITNVSLNMKSADPEIRDMYNLDPVFAVPSEKLATYVSRLKKNISQYDMMDGHQDWNHGDLNKLTTVLTEDYLIVDAFTPCQKSSFFEIERALLLGQPHESCGGRDPNDNAVNKIYTLYEKGAQAMPSLAVNDGLTGPAQPISKNFPYLTAPYDGPAAWLAEKLANLAKDFL